MREPKVHFVDDEPGKGVVNHVSHWPATRAHLWYLRRRQWN